MNSEWKPVFIEEKLAVAGMPPYWVEEWAVGFNTVFSLATPYEHSMYGYDPRVLEALGKRFYWFSIPEYNAPKLVSLAKLVKSVEESIAGGVVLVHSRRGCGRLAVFTASWLMKRAGEAFSPALAQASRLRGCGVETAPQLGVLKAFNTACRGNVVEEIAGFKGSIEEREEATMEYSFMLLYELYGIVEVTPKEVMSDVGRGETGIVALAEALYDAYGYSVADIRLLSRSPIVLDVTVWVPRETHPGFIAGREPKRNRGVERELLRVVKSVLGYDASLSVNLVPADKIPLV